MSIREREREWECGGREGETPKSRGKEAIAAVEPGGLARMGQ
jgi:hypothetical protein